MNHFGLLLCLSTYLLVSTDVEAIVGGYIAPPQEYKYQIALLENNETVCGGAIISGWHILSAAHCVTEPNGEFTTTAHYVVAGAPDVLNRGPHAVTIAVEKVYIPREFIEDGSPGDIAVLKLRQRLPLGTNPMLSELVMPQDRTFVGMEATVTGYGWTWINPITEVGGAEARKRKFAIANVLPNNVCLHYKRSYNPNKVLCAKMHQRPNMNEGICVGDSGGPLVLGNVVIGVISTGPYDCDERRSAAFYTRVSAFRNFIINAMNNRALNSMRVYEHR